MPPQHLLPRDAHTLVPLCRDGPAVNITDLSGAPLERIAAVVRARPASHRVFVVSSGVFPLPLPDLRAVAAFGPHLCLEHAADYLACVRDGRDCFRALVHERWVAA